MTKNTKEKIIKDEKKILSELIKNAKENIDTIAKRCKFSTQKIRKSIKHLEEENTIWGYTAIFNEEKIGLMHFTFMVKRNNNTVPEKIIEQIISRKLEDFTATMGIAIESSYFVHGEYDWIITFTARDIIHAREFVNALLELNPNIIEKIMILQTMMFIRKQYILNPEREKLKEFL